MKSPKIAAHMIVKNEDQWVWFAIQSILPYVDRLLICDTGSTDRTVECIQSISSPKIEFEQVEIANAADVTAIRQKQLDKTHEEWMWAIDGDEIYPEDTAREVHNAIASGKYEGISVRRYDLLGDIYHRQQESVGEYSLFGQKGHLVVRALNLRTMPHMTVKGDYPLEGYYDNEGVAIIEHDPSLHYITQSYLYHAMYLRRSSRGSNIADMINRSKYKIETGMSIPGAYPKVFNLPRPDFVPDPLRHRSFVYESVAHIVTPIKNLKRKIMT